MTELLANAEFIAPLLQTALWVSLAVGVLWRFHRQIDALLAAFRARIESGSSLKIGPVEIEQLRSQDPVEQKQRVIDEVREIEKQQTTTKSNGEIVGMRIPIRQMYEAEDLALRAIQVEFGRPVSRQVSLGARAQFDGAFTLNGRFHVVEVKYVFKQTEARTVLRRTIERTVQALQKLEHKNVELVVALVLEKEDFLEAVQSDVSRPVEAEALPVTVRIFSLNALRKRFGIED